jgi:hypothetical protein
MLFFDDLDSKGYPKILILALRCDSLFTMLPGFLEGSAVSFSKLSRVSSGIELG